MGLLDDFIFITCFGFNINIEDGEWLISFEGDSEYDGDIEETQSGRFLQCLPYG